MTANIVQLLIENARLFPDKPAIIHGKDAVTYGQLLELVQSQSTLLRSKGIGRYDRVLVFIPMGIPLYLMLLGLAYRGAVAVFLDAWASVQRIEQALKIIDCKGFAGIPRAHLLRLFSKKIREIPIHLWTGKHFKIAGAGEFDPPVQVSSEETALVTFTTGSTGTPKAANRTHGFLIAQHQALKNHIYQNPDNVELITLPVFVLNSLATGTTSVIPHFNPAKPHNFNPTKIINEISVHKIQSAIASPVFFEKLAKHIIRTGKSTSFKQIALGGAPVFVSLAKKLIQAFPKTGIEIVYGSTEAEPIAAVDAQKMVDHSIRFPSPGLYVGKPSSEITIKIIEIQDSPISVSTEKEFDKVTLPQGQIGEICVTGNHVLKKYLNCPEAEEENKIRCNGRIFHRTGDAGYLDSNGELYLMGRVKSRFSAKGKIFFPFCAEQILSEIDGIILGTVIAVGDRLVCVVELIKGKIVNEEQIIAHLGTVGIEGIDGIKKMAIPRDPRHHSKIDYGRLRMELDSVPQR